MVEIMWHRPETGQKLRKQISTCSIGKNRFTQRKEGLVAMHFYGYDNDVNQVFQQTKINSRIPAYEKYFNAIYFPPHVVGKTDCLYDESRNLILTSCVLRGPNKSENISEAPLSISPINKIKRVKGKYIFLGNIENIHYGHLLTEGVSRLWFYLMYQQKVKEYKFVCPGSNFKTIKSLIKLFVMRKKRSEFATIAKYLNLDKKKFKFFSKPVIIEEVIIPEPTFSNRAEAYKAHKLVFDKVTDIILKEITIAKSDIPLYLSRRKLDKTRRKILNEEKMEQYIRSIGGDVIYPESLSLEKQIILFNKHKFIIGCIGSSFHTLLFANFSDLKIIYLSDHYPNLNYFMIDKLKNINSNYIDCLNRVNHSHQDFVIDYMKAVFYLEKILGLDNKDE